jgi:hypothetical protein
MRGFLRDCSARSPLSFDTDLVKGNAGPLVAPKRRAFLTCDELCDRSVLDRAPARAAGRRHGLGYGEKMTSRPLVALLLGFVALGAAFAAALVVI